MDAGEGVAGYLNNKVSAIKHIWISHPHIDHISGLTALLGLRQIVPGDSVKPLHIWTHSEAVVKTVKKMLDMFFPAGLGYPLEINLVSADESIPLLQDVYMQAVPTEHTLDSAGIEIYRLTKRLADHRREDQTFMDALSAGTVTPVEGDYVTVRNIKVLHLLDNGGIKCNRNLTEAELLFEDFTFPIDADCTPERVLKHNSSERVAARLKQLQPKTAILTHISTRYSGLHVSTLLKNLNEKLKNSTTNLIVNKPNREVLNYELAW